MRDASPIAGFVLGLIALTATAAAEITIKHLPPDIRTRTFDPQNPPPERPPLRDDEAAVTESKYACGVEMEVQTTQEGGEKPKMIITGLKAELTLEVIIWLPSHPPARLRAHENGHREIAETFHNNGAAIARKIAEKYIGRQLEIANTDPTETRPVIQRAANEFCGEYLGATEVPQEKVQERYDNITDHGRRNIPVPEAIKKAMAEKK